MKKIFILTMMVMALVACTKKQENTIEKAQDTNTWKDVQTIEEANTFAGFEFNMIEKLERYTRTIQVSESEPKIIQIIFEKDGEEIVQRQAKTDEDISGDVTDYKDSQDYEFNGLKVNLKGNDGKFYVASLKNDGFTYSITSNKGYSYLDLMELMMKFQ